MLHLQDEHVNRVVNIIQGIGSDPYIMYPEKFGDGYYLNLIEGSDEINSLSVTTEQGAVNIDQIYSVWFRRPRLVSLEQVQIPLQGVEFARDEWKSALEAFYAMMKNILWVSHPDNLRIAARKPVQLELAQTMGLKIPKTLITNQPDKAKEFFEMCDGKIIVKATGNGWIYTNGETEVSYVLTNRVSKNDILDSGEISLSPITLQEEIAKDYELRVNIVGQKVLTIKIDSQKSKISELDWRRYDVNNTPYSPYSLPPDVEVKCLRLAQKLGLEFGAIDLIRQPDGEYVFLEINGNGQFLWAEDLSGVRISNEIACLLSGTTSPLKFANL